MITRLEVWLPVVREFPDTAASTRDTPSQAIIAALAKLEEVRDQVSRDMLRPGSAELDRRGITLMVDVMSAEDGATVREESEQ